MDGPGFHVEVGVLESAAAGIRQSVADQKGSALEDLDAGSATYGHDGLHGAMENFCDRWNGETANPPLGGRCSVGLDA